MPRRLPHPQGTRSKAKAENGRPAWRTRTPAPTGRPSLVSPAPLGSQSPILRAGPRVAKNQKQLGGFPHQKPGWESSSKNGSPGAFSFRSLSTLPPLRCSHPALHTAGGREGKSGRVEKVLSALRDSLSFPPNSSPAPPRKSQATRYSSRGRMALTESTKSF